MKKEPIKIERSLSPTDVDEGRITIGVEYRKYFSEYKKIKINGCDFSTYDTGATIYINGLKKLPEYNAKKGSKIILTGQDDKWTIVYSDETSCSDEKKGERIPQQPVQREEKCKKTSTDNMPILKSFKKPTKEGESIESQAVYYFEDYMAENCSDRFKLIVDDKEKVISDIRRRKEGYDSVFADYVVYDTERKKKAYFEIKGTSKTEQYWGGVTFKELKSAINANDEYDYYFAIICIDKNRKDHFVHPKRDSNDDPCGVFLTLDEFLPFTTRASLGIQFIMKYPQGERGGLEDGKGAFKRDDVEEFLNNEFILNNI